MTDRHSGHSEIARQWVHIGSGLFALLLRVLNGWQATAMAAAALVFNLVLLPHVGGRRLYRPVDHERGFPLGILLYPLAVLALTLAFPSRLDIAAAAWGILAFGDGFATLIGRQATTINAERALMVSSSNHEQSAAPSGRLPWNSDKSIAGTLAFIVFGAFAGVALAWWVRPSIAPMPSLEFTLVAPVVAAVLAAMVETIPVRLDDNVSVPATAAGILWLASLMTADAIAGSRGAVAAALPWAIGVNVLTAWLGYRARTVSRSGALGGLLVGVLIYLGGGGGAWLLLLATFLIASVDVAPRPRSGRSCWASRRSAAAGAVPATPSPTAASRRWPRSRRSTTPHPHAGAGCAGRRADRRRQRHGRQRDREGVGTLDVSSHLVRPRAAGNAGRDVARRDGRRTARGARRSPPSRRRSA